MEEITEHITVVNELGMHTRPAAKVVQTVVTYKSEVYISHNGHRVNAKSIMGLLTLAAAQGTILTVTCKGDDARQAMDAIRALFASKFGED